MLKLMNSVCKIFIKNDDVSPFSEPSLRTLWLPAKPALFVGGRPPVGQQPPPGYSRQPGGGGDGGGGGGGGGGAVHLMHKSSPVPGACCHIPRFGYTTVVRTRLRRDVQPTFSPTVSSTFSPRLSRCVMLLTLVAGCWVYLLQLCGMPTGTL